MKKISIILFFILSLFSCKIDDIEQPMISVNEAKNYFETNAKELKTLEVKIANLHECKDHDCQEHEIILTPVWDNAKQYKEDNYSKIEIPIKYDSELKASIINYSSLSKQTVIKGARVLSFLIIEKKANNYTMYVENYIGYNEQNSQNFKLGEFYPSQNNKSFNGFIISNKLDGTILSSAYSYNNNITKIESKNANNLKYKSFVNYIVYQNKTSAKLIAQYTSGCPEYGVCSKCFNVEYLTNGLCYYCSQNPNMGTCRLCGQTAELNSDLLCSICSTISFCPVCGSQSCVGASGGQCSSLACPYCGRIQCKGGQNPGDCTRPCSACGEEFLGVGPLCAGDRCKYQ